MFDPEFYVGAWRLPGEAWRTTKYTEGASVPEGAEVVTWERRVFFCVPVPGEAPWARGSGGGAGGDAGGASGAAAAAAAAASRADKRRRGDAGEEADASMDSDASLTTPEASPASADSKRTRPLAGGAGAAGAAPHAAGAAAAEPLSGLPPDPAGQAFILKARARTPPCAPAARCTLPAFFWALHMCPNNSWSRKHMHAHTLSPARCTARRRTS
jgi:hypothetical protein